MRRKKGSHAIIEFFGCKEFLLDDILFIKKLFRKVAKDSNLSMIDNGMVFHKFNPGGLTGIALLSSSHISIHTWPEYKYATIDIYACDKKEKVMKAVQIFIEALQPKKVKKIILRRGIISNSL